jgi:cytochrome oxidase Cu insertion factor (SCO1/SenC/PrrC family)
MPPAVRQALAVFGDAGASSLGDMAVESTMVPLGSWMPEFVLTDVSGHQLKSTDLAGAPTLVVFLCNHCPYVRHVETRLGGVLHEFADLQAVGICSNDAVAYPDDAPERLAEQARRADWRFPYLVDTTQEVTRSFAAACTPDFFLYDEQGRLAYRGAFDSSTPGNGVPVTGDLLTAAIRHVLADEPVPEPHRPSMGCSIKWRA